jgi:hypothetical protein
MRYVLHWRIGDAVTLADDPRHVGEIEAIYNSASAKVRWRDTNWLSFESLSDLAEVKKEKQK